MGISTNLRGRSTTSSEFKGLTLTGGRIEHATGRGSSDQTGLAVAGGTESNQFDLAGGDWNVTKDLTAQYYYANLDNYYTQHFFGLIHTLVKARTISPLKPTCATSKLTRQVQIAPVMVRLQN